MHSRLSRYTLVVSGLGLAGAVVVYAAVRLLLAAGQEAEATAVSDFGEAAVVALAAVIVLRTAFSFRPGEAVRRYWLLIGAGVAMFAAGDLVWSVIEVVMGQDSFPSLADAFYVSQYLLFGTGVGLAAAGYRHLLDVRRPLAYAAACSLAVAGGLYVVLLRTIIADPELDVATKALSLFYPLADVALELFPALFIAFIAWRLGRGTFGWPWWPVAAGLLVLAVSDAGFAWLDWQGLYEPGHLVDAGWMIGQMLVATGALVARDVFGVNVARVKLGKAA